MSWAFHQTSIDSLFDVLSGSVHSTLELDTGTIPLVSCGATENGLVGYFDIEPKQRRSHCVTVAYNGSWPLLAQYHPYQFAAKDDVAVLVPHQKMKEATLLYVAAILNTMIWRYNYGRKCFRTKLKKLLLSVPMSNGHIAEDAIAALAPVPVLKHLPPKAVHQLKLTPPPKWKFFGVSDLFNIMRGDFHSLQSLGPGNCLTVSRVTSDNGIVGQYERPKDAHTFHKGSVTVSTVGGDAFVQLEDFIATDNVLVCSPKQPLQATTMFFVAMMLNLQKWRYSYGRQCYKTKFAATKIPMPVQGGSTLDEPYMKAVVENTDYWHLVKATLARN